MALGGFLIALAVIFMAMYFASEQVQKYLYDDNVDGLWWRCLASAVPLAGLLVARPVDFTHMFTDAIGWTLVHAVVWSFLYWRPLCYLFWHAVSMGVLSALLFAPLVTMAIQSFMKKSVTL